MRATEQLVRQTVEPRQRKPSRTAPAVDPNVRAAESKLRRQFGTQVRIVTDDSGRGKIEFEFYNASDLDRLYSLLLRQVP